LTGSSSVPSSMSRDVVSDIDRKPLALKSSPSRGGFRWGWVSLKVAAASRKHILTPALPLKGRELDSRGFSRLLQPREPELLALRQVTFGHRLRQPAHAQDGALAFGDGDRAARVEQVEAVRGLHHLLVGRQRQAQLDQAQGLGLAGV